MKKNKWSKWTALRASHAGQVWCADLITAQVGSFSFLCFGPCRPFWRRRRSGLRDHIMCATHQSSSVRQSDNRPSRLIFLFMLWPVVGPFEEEEAVCKTTSRVPRASQIWCANLITAQVDSFFIFMFWP